MSDVDNLARPAHPEASRHLVPPSPKYCLRQCPGGRWYLIPFIYEWGFSEFVREWRLEHGIWDSPTPKQLPAYAKPIDVSLLTFETPLMVPREPHDD